MIDLELKCAEVKYRYGISAVVNLSVKVAAGEKLVVLGDYLSGKTTLLKLLAGLVPLSDGLFLYGGEDAKTLSIKQRDALFVWDDSQLFNFRTALYNLTYPLKIRGVDRSTAENRALDALRSVGLDGKAHRLAVALNRSERILLQYVRVFMRDASIYLIDDLYRKLGEQDRNSLLTVLLPYLKSKSGIVVIATENLQEVLPFTDNILMLSQGVQIAAGKYADLCDDPQYLGVPKMLGQAGEIRECCIVKDENGGFSVECDNKSICRVDIAYLLDSLYVGKTVLHCKIGVNDYLFDYSSEKKIYPIKM